MLDKAVSDVQAVIAAKSAAMLESKAKLALAVTDTKVKSANETVGTVTAAPSSRSSGVTAASVAKDKVPVTTRAPAAREQQPAATIVKPKSDATLKDRQITPVVQPVAKESKSTTAVPAKLAAAQVSQPVANTPMRAPVSSIAAPLVSAAPSIAPVAATAINALVSPMRAPVARIAPALQPEPAVKYPTPATTEAKTPPTLLGDLRPSVSMSSKDDGDDGADIVALALASSGMLDQSSPARQDYMSDPLGLSHPMQNLYPASGLFGVDRSAPAAQPSDNKPTLAAPQLMGGLFPDATTSHMMGAQHPGSLAFPGFYTSPMHAPMPLQQHYSAPQHPLGGMFAVQQPIGGVPTHYPGMDTPLEADPAGPFFRGSSDSRARPPPGLGMSSAPRMPAPAPQPAPWMQQQPSYAPMQNPYAGWPPHVAPPPGYSTGPQIPSVSVPMTAGAASYFQALSGMPPMSGPGGLGYPVQQMPRGPPGMVGGAAPTGMGISGSTPGGPLMDLRLRGFY
jgi:hypothetical protein